MNLLMQLHTWLSSHAERVVDAVIVLSPVRPSILDLSITSDQSQHYNDAGDLVTQISDILSRNLTPLPGLQLPINHNRLPIVPDDDVVTQTDRKKAGFFSLLQRSDAKPARNGSAPQVGVNTSKANKNLRSPSTSILPLETTREESVWRFLFF